MPLYEYVAKDSQGKTITGRREAAAANDLIQWLREQNHIIIRVNELKPKAELFSAGSLGGKKARKIKLDELVIFSRQLATMVEAGIPLVQALNILAEQVENLNMQRIVMRIHDDVESGKSLSEALHEHKKIFSTLFVSMVQAGESSGNLEEILDRLASYIEKTSALQKKVKSVMIYPCVVASMAGLITFVMMTWVIPKFAEIFKSLNAPLPTPTLILIQASELLRSNLIQFVLGVIIFIFIFVRIIRTPWGGLWFDTLKLKIPIFGPILLKVAVSKFSRTLSTLVRSGVPILNAFEIVGKTAENRQIDQLVQEVRNAIKEGESISKPLSKRKLFPPMVVRMVAVGEETGELDKMLSKIADFYEIQVDTAVTGLTSLIEPLVIAFLGIVIGGIVFAMFLPILTLTQAIH